MVVILNRSNEIQNFDKQVEILKKRFSEKTNAKAIAFAVKFVSEEWPEIEKSLKKQISDLSVFRDNYYSLRNLVIKRQDIENSIVEVSKFGN